MDTNYEKLCRKQKQLTRIILNAKEDEMVDIN